MPTIRIDGFETLPDYVRPGLRLLFVGINPGTYSVARGHHFARRTSRFWPAFSRSRLSLPVRRALGREVLEPTDDARLLDYGIGFTDVVKRPTPNAARLTVDDYRAGARRLLGLLEANAPDIACFHGITGFRAFARHGLGASALDGGLGPQPLRPGTGTTRLYVVPNPSPANAHYTLADQIAWYDRLADFLDGGH